MIEVIRRKDDARHWVLAVQAKGERVGLVPTMGALHAGHASLIRAAANDCDRVAVSIFVNPTQFGPGEDFERYPRPADADLALCEAEGVDMVFHPDPGAMYLPDHCSYVNVKRLTKGLEGAYRPGFFRGVATIVLKLFNIVPADAAYFGEKDAQQLAVVRRMVRDLDVPVEIIACPTVREPDGLALSSRNAYLTSAERRAAPALSGALLGGRTVFLAGEREPARVAALALTRLRHEPMFSPQYLECVDADSFATAAAPLSGNERLVAAAFLGATRLIDNIALREEPS